MQPELTEQVVEPESCLAAAYYGCIAHQAAGCELGSNQVVNSVDTFLANKFGQDERRCWGFMMVTRQRVCARRDKSRSMLSWSAAHSAYTRRRSVGRAT